MIEQGYKLAVAVHRWVSPSEFWKMHPQELWWLIEAQDAMRVFRGKRFTLTKADADGIVADLRAEGIEPKWPQKSGR